MHVMHTHVPSAPPSPADVPAAHHQREAQRCAGLASDLLALVASALVDGATLTATDAAAITQAAALVSLAHSELSPRVRVGTRPPVRHEHRTVRTVDLTPPSSPPLADVDLQQLVTDIVMCAPSATSHPTPSEAYLTIRVPELVEVIAHGLARLGYRVVHIHG